MINPGVRQRSFSHGMVITCDGVSSMVTGVPLVGESRPISEYGKVGGVLSSACEGDILIVDQGFPICLGAYFWVDNEPIAEHRRGGAEGSGVAVIVVGILAFRVGLEGGGKECDLGVFLGVLRGFDTKERGSDEGNVSFGA
jgi:hypothetical protein